MSSQTSRERQNSYTIRQLLDELGRMVDSDGISDDTLVMIATQPSWPFENTIHSVVAVDLNQDGDEEVPDKDGYLEPIYVVYLGEGKQVGYLPPPAKSALGWSR